MYYGNIKKYDVADGEGVRVSLFVSGCTVQCPFCFQKQTWDFCFGREYTKETEDEIIEALKENYISGLTTLGGEPFEFVNQEELVKLFRRVRKELPNRTIWSYSGHVYDRDLIPGGKRYGEYTDEMLDMLDVLIDGPFIQEKKNISLAYRGSENQRVINMKETRKLGKVVLYCD